jgi:hydrogenase expression/formation protein HypC
MYRIPCASLRSTAPVHGAKDAASEQLDMMLIGEQPPGTWVLAFHGSALRLLDPDEAARTNAALDTRSRARRCANVDAYFADLIDRDNVVSVSCRCRKHDSNR